MYLPTATSQSSNRSGESASTQQREVWSRSFTYSSLSMWSCIWYFAKSFFSLRTVCKGLFARNVTTNFKFYARMGCVIYYVTCTWIANLLCKSPVCEPVHASWVSSQLMHFHASRSYTLTYIHIHKHSEVYESQTNSWGMNWLMNWLVNWLMTWFMNWWLAKWLCDLCA